MERKYKNSTLGVYFMNESAVRVGHEVALKPNIAQLVGSLRMCNMSIYIVCEV
jgi:hypothetical protein